MLPKIRIRIKTMEVKTKMVRTMITPEKNIKIKIANAGPGESVPG
jgi:hypothetical protein